MRIRTSMLVATFTTVISTACMVLVSANEDAASPFSITVRHVDDSIKVQSEDERTIFSIRSPRGIGQAEIRRETDSWPQHVVLRLHLKGLEGFRISNGAVTLHASVSSHGANPTIRSWKDNDETVTLDSESPYWMNLKLLDQNGEPTRDIPQGKGVIEIQLPTAILDGKPEKLTIHWIDFYRG
ncbi:hypothetical protein [Aporhodopirellula aestuarii]|uniref:Secreted protein n=1 Tax=Aporhodopirellula aestuarii TaxID=2950107 RepID=A0ABT0U0W4_9BACT|nr:hypothetical protein [Aporhodopirellula aestuarii]MCM2370522.1 hypothetical protein [Aporhodopirellula aestuarii]